MTNKESKRAELAEKVADYLLTNGLSQTSLRPMAATLGTSDRMLLHYFTDKEELLTHALDRITQRLIDLLNSSRPSPMPLHTLISAQAALLNNPVIRPFLALWLELTALSASSLFYRTRAKEIGVVYMNWLESVILVDDETLRKPLASLAYIIIEGIVLLDAAGNAPLISEALDGLSHLSGAS